MPTTVVSRLRDHLSTIVEDLAVLIREMPIEYFDRGRGGDIVIICPDYHWGKPSPLHRAEQVRIKREHDKVAELFTVLLRGAPSDFLQELKDVDESFRMWLELESNWGLKPDQKNNERLMRSAAADFEKLLTVLDASGSGDVILVPDTNSLLSQADPVQYRSIANDDVLTFMLLPTVLGELDRLKIEHRNPDVREKAKDAIRRIKGWRQQGPLIAGVTVAQTITVRARHNEPDMKTGLSWLDPAVQDDRLIASIMELQAEEPSSRLVLVTADINLQNKADAALIQTSEPPVSGSPT